MKYCSACGAGNPDSRTACSECGASLPKISASTETIQTTNRSRRKSSGKPILVAVAMAVLVGVVTMVTFLPGRNPMAKAVALATDELAEVAQEQPLLWSFIEHNEELLKHGEYTFSLKFTSKAGSKCVEGDYSRKNKVLRGEYVDDVKTVELAFSVDKKDVQIASRSLTSNVYGAVLKDLEQKYQTSFLPSVLPISIPEDIEWEIFAKNSGKNLLEAFYGDNLDAFKETLAVEKLGKRNLMMRGQLASCNAFRVTWSSKALNTLLGSGLWLGELLTKILPEVEPDCIVYVDAKGRGVGFDYVTMGTQCLLVLEGEARLLDQFTLTVKSLHDDPVVYTGGLREMGSMVHLYLKNLDEQLLSAYFDNDTGEFSLETKSKGEILRGKIQQTGAMAKLEISWNSDMTGRNTLVWTMRVLEQTPEKLAEGYTNVLDMSLTDWQRLLLDLNVRIP